MKSCSTAFGIVLEDRDFSSASYRYGFNGMEKDDEMKGSGNSYDFGARLYDSRLGRWLSVDPSFGNFAWLSPYAAFSNNPLYWVDANGKSPSNPIYHSNDKNAPVLNPFVEREMHNAELKDKESGNCIFNGWTYDRELWEKNSNSLTRISSGSNIYYKDDENGTRVYYEMAFVPKIVKSKSADGTEKEEVHPTEGFYVMTPISLTDKSQSFTTFNRVPTANITLPANYTPQQSAGAATKIVGQTQQKIRLDKQSIEATEPNVDASSIQLVSINVTFNPNSTAAYRNAITQALQNKYGTRINFNVGTEAQVGRRNAAQITTNYSYKSKD